MKNFKWKICVCKKQNLILWAHCNNIRTFWKVLLFSATYLEFVVLMSCMSFTVWRYYWYCFGHFFNSWLRLAKLEVQKKSKSSADMIHRRKNNALVARFEILVVRPESKFARLKSFIQFVFIHTFLKSSVLKLKVLLIGTETQKYDFIGLALGLDCSLAIER